MAAQIKCEFCGGYIKDTDAYCPNCGAANNNLTRSSSGTPKTIEELKKWYSDHNLPPEEVTRFFIGKDVKGPKAFGIYKKNKNVVVYKNKADGSRVVRYEGEDEAYAVREIFLKLKEEILNQKNINAAKKNGGSNKGRSSGNQKRSYAANTYAPPKKTKRNWAPLIAILVIIALFAGCAGIAAKMNHDDPDTGTYYYSESAGLYYFQNNYYVDIDGRNLYRSQWWCYDEDKDDWNVEYYDSYGYPDELSYKNKLSDTNKPDFSYLDVLDSLGYKDSKHQAPRQGYYHLDDTDTTYYYLSDYFGKEIGKEETVTGWYVSTDDGWELYGDDRRDAIPDELWDNADAYYWGNAYDDENWDFSDFTGTQWYDDSIENYYTYKETHKSDTSYSYSSDDDDDYSSWDDDDWSWDDNDSWSSDYTDWDSDW